MKILLKIVVISSLLLSCSSSKLVNHWESTEAYNFEANKVLVIGMSSNVESRRLFEDKLVSELEKNGVIAVKSIDFFEQSFTENKKTVEDLNKIETLLLETGFDAILLSKVTSTENKVTLVNVFKNVDQNFKNFREDYYQNQEIYYEESYLSESKIYHTETNLYCICPDKERELLWKGIIDITNPNKTKKSITDYVRILINELKTKHVLITH